MQMCIATSTDVKELTALINNCYRGDVSRKGWTTEADLLDGIRIDEKTLLEYINEPNSEILLYRDDDKAVIGSVYLKQLEVHMYLGMLTVRPDRQASGLGKAILRTAEQRAAKAGSKKIIMTVIASRTELIDWYKRRGYSDTGERQPFDDGERFGKPKIPLTFMILEKNLAREK